MSSKNTSIQDRDCNNSSNHHFDGDSLSLHPYAASYNITDQDINDQIATINSLTISDQQHPMDILAADTRNSPTATIRGIFPDNTAFTPQSTDRYLFHNTSFSIQSEYTANVLAFGGGGGGGGVNRPFTRLSSMDNANSNQDLIYQLTRRESYPNLSMSYNRSMANISENSYLDWQQNYMQNPTVAEEHHHQSSNTMFSTQQQRQQQSLYRKFSVDLPPTGPSFASKRLDVLGKSNNRLTPSHSNPDLGSSARRMGNLDASGVVSSKRYDQHNNNGSDEFSNMMMESNALQQHYRNNGRHHSLFNTAIYNNQLLPSMATSTVTPSALISSPSSSSLAANPLLVSHYMRQISKSRPPSPPFASSSRKNSTVIQQKLRRTSSATAMNVSSPSAEQDKFGFIQLEDIVDDIYTLCKDQLGCRFLQKKLEEQTAEQRDIIFTQIYPHFVELMTDPFGNYLCQKLLEYCTDTQRTMMVEQVANGVVPISFNMHGTRAMQKMIEFLTLPEQIEKTIQALSPNVVALIKDINGNHVIQKCLHRLSSHDKQFIYDAVSESCIEVATHRNGCCVLQRCIDFSVDSQKKQLVDEIVQNALVLVQDPYGNYVVQYVLELGDAHFSDQLIRQFIGHISSLSIQKYSSNVMEKCIRVAEEDTRRHLIEEMVNRTQLEKLLKDSYANYVVQTALDFAEETQHQKLAECIRPLLPGIRNTSYCKRIQSKLNRNQQQQQLQSFQGQHFQQFHPFHNQQQQQPHFQQQGYLGGSTLVGGVHPLGDIGSFTSSSAPFRPPLSSNTTAFFNQ